MKRIIRVFLSAVLLISFVLPYISGCVTNANNNYYTVMQWLDKVERSFNLLYYSEQEPFFTSVKTSDPDFDTVQIAAEWGIINPEDNLKFNDKLTKEFAADTLIRAMNCVTPSTIEISDSQKVNPLYLENVMSSVNEGIFSLETDKFNPRKLLSVAEADGALLVAYDKWINFSYGESFDRSIIKENVINLGGVTSENNPVVQAEYSVKYTGSKTFFDENGGYTDNTNKTITFPAGKVPSGLTVGTVLAMPADDVVPMNYAVVVTEVKTKGDGSVTVSTRNAELQDVYEEIDIQQSGEVDFSEAIFYGPDGQRITFGNEEAADMLNTFGDMDAEPMGLNYCASETADMSLTSLGLYNPGEHETAKMKNEQKATVKLGNGISVTISKPFTNNGKLGFEIKGEVEEDGEKLSIDLDFNETVKVENCIKTHWDLFKLKVDTLRFSKTETQTISSEFSCSAVEKFGTIQNKVNKRGDGWDIGDWSTEGLKLRKIYGSTQTVGQNFKSLSTKAKNESNKKIFDIIIPKVNLHFVIRAELSVEGSLKLTLTQSNTSGVELVKGKLRTIHDKTNSQQLDLSAKIELAFRVAFEYQLIGINVADFGCKAGIGANVSSIVYSFDKSSGSLMEVCGIPGAVSFGEAINAGNVVQIAEAALQIQTDETRTDSICYEIKVYPILTVYGCSSSSVAGKLFGSIECKVLHEDTPFLMVHYEINENGGGIVSECSISANDNYGITTGDKLTLNMDAYAISVSEDADTGLAVVTLPKGTSIKDINIASDNTDVLEAENLLHKVTADVLPSASPELKIESSALSNFLPKKWDAELNLEFTHKFGSSFYQDVSGNPKPQFALTGKKNGKANVTVTVGGESVTVPVKVGTGEETIVSTGALIGSKGTFTLTSGETAQTAFDFIPEGKTISDIAFTSANSSVATVSKGGLITAVGNGDTVITATLKGQDKDYSTTFTVHVV